MKNSRRGNREFADDQSTSRRRSLTESILIVRAPPPFFDGSDKERCACTYLPSFNPRRPNHTQWDAGYDESVEVNQRALIDKVLARYSGEFTGTFYVLSPEADNLNTGA